jgi:peptide/nickel transport system permease protein
LVFGGLAGYTYGRWPDKIISWLISLAYTVPVMLIVVAVFAVVEPSIERAYIVIGCIGWVAPARLVRAEVARLRSSPFVLAERSFGSSEVGIFTFSILPLCFKPAVISALYYLPELVGLEVGLSFFGLSAQPPTPTLGRLIYDGVKEFPSAWWLALLPSGLFLLMIISIYIFTQVFCRGRAISVTARI